MRIKNIALKTGISVFLCIVISKLLHLKYPFFAALPAFVPISSSTAESLKAGINRMLGTLIGASIGIIFAFIKPGNSILCGIGMIIIIYLCNYIRWGSSASIAGLVFISIMISIKGENPLTYSVDRISDTFIGIIVTLLVNNLLFHSNFVCEITNRCYEIRLIILNSIKEKICNNKDIQFSQIDDKIEEVKKELNNYLQEYVLRKETKKKIDQFNEIINRFICIDRHLKLLCSINKPFKLNNRNSKAFETFFNTECICEGDSDNETNVVFNYHLEKLFEDLLIINGIFTSSCKKVNC